MDIYRKHAKYDKDLETVDQSTKHKFKPRQVPFGNSFGFGNDIGVREKQNWCDDARSRFIMLKERFRGILI